MKIVAPPEGSSVFEIEGMVAHTDDPKAILAAVDEVLEGHGLEVVLYDDGTDEPFWFRFDIQPRTREDLRNAV